MNQILDRNTINWLAILAVASYTLVFIIILTGENKLENKLLAKNDQLWLELKTQTAETIRERGRAESLKIELEELQARTNSLFDPQVLTPSEKKKKK
jgi:hypothetical protein